MMNRADQNWPNSEVIEIENEEAPVYTGTYVSETVEALITIVRVVEMKRALNGRTIQLGGR